MALLSAFAFGFSAFGRWGTSIRPQNTPPLQAPPVIDYGQGSFRRRNRLKKHFVITSNVLLFGYPHVSLGKDACKVI